MQHNGRIANLAKNLSLLTIVACQPFSTIESTHFLDETDTYELSITYPIVSLGNEEVDQTVNERIALLVEENRDWFLTQYGEEDPLEDYGTKNGLWIDYEVVTQSESYLSIAFTISWYGAGAAHPNHGNHVLNVDLENDWVMSLEDLFLPGAEYIDRVSQEATRELLKPETMSTEEWIADGAGPDESNFSSWALTEDGLLLLFDPYQVGPYAAGTVRVTIPFKQLDDMLNDETKELIEAL